MAEIGLTGNRAIYEQVATNHDMSSGTVAFTISDNISTFTNLGVQAIWSSVTASSSVSGKIRVQFSNDGTNWDIAEYRKISINSANGSGKMDIKKFGSRYARVYLTKTDITGGTLNIHLVAKD